MADLIQDALNLKYSSNINIVGTSEEVANLILETASDVSTTIYGNVSDGTNPIPNATVKAFDNTGAPYAHTMTDTDGNYSLEGLLAGTYDVAVVCDGYIMSASQNTTLSDGSTVEVNFTLTPDASLTLGAITGIVTTGTDTLTPVENVKLSLMDNTNTAIAVTFTVDDGEYVFYDVEDGAYTIIATAQGYFPSEPIDVNIVDGAIVNQNINMVQDTRNFNGTINGVITNTDGDLVPDCFVGLYQITDDGAGHTEELLVAYTKTNAQGKYLFGNVVEGNYVVKAKMNA